jgi:Ser/Thr protein kinase RdoA (MazF antagonist)
MAIGGGHLINSRAKYLARRSQALERLNQLPDGDALCHGDYHPDNVLMTRNGPIIID